MAAPLCLFNSNRYLTFVVLFRNLDISKSLSELNEYFDTAVVLVAV